MRRRFGVIGIGILMAGVLGAAPLPAMQEPGPAPAEAPPLAPVLLSIRQASTRFWRDWLLEVREDGLVRYGGADQRGGIMICTQGEPPNDWTRPPEPGRVTWRLDAARLASVVALVRELAGAAFAGDPDLKPDEQHDVRTWTLVTGAGTRTIMHAAGDAGLPPGILRLEDALERATLLWRHLHRTHQDWLTRHHEDGRGWKAGGIPGSCNPFYGAGCDGNGDTSFDGVVTALAVLCLTCCGYDDATDSPYRDVLRDGFRVLEAGPSSAATPGSPESPHAALDAACRALAAVEAAALRSSPERKRSAADALARLAAFQRADGAFVGPADDPADAPAATGFAVFAFWKACNSGVAGDSAALEAARTRLSRVRKSRTAGPLDRAVDAAIALRCGDVASGTGLAALLDALEADLASPALSLRKPGAEFLFFATAAMALAGGERFDRWSKAVKPYLTGSEIKDESCALGSWDPATVRDLRGGRLWTTTLMTLALEVYYRYPSALAGAPAGSGLLPK